jgi:hypothetical protein
MTLLQETLDEQLETLPNNTTIEGAFRTLTLTTWGILHEGGSYDIDFSKSSILQGIALIP